MRLLLIGISSLFLLSCTGMPSEINKSKMLIIGKVETGPLGASAYLAEECINNIPYYVLVYRSRFSMATRYDAKGKIPACLQQAPSELPEYKVMKKGEMGGSKARLGSVCLGGIEYLYANTLYSAALVESRSDKGQLKACR